MALIWKGKALSFDNPIIEKNGVLMLPLQDSLALLDAEVTYSRRDDTYSLKFKKTKQVIILSAGADFFWLNNVPKKLAVPAANIDGVFYFPLDTVLTSIGYQVSKQTDRILVSQAPVVSKSPPLLFLNLGTQVHPVIEAQTVKGILFAYLDDLFPKLGFTVYEGDPETVSKGTQKKRLTGAILNAQKKRLYPLFSTLSSLGFSLYKLDSTHYQILPHLLGVQFRENALDRVFLLSSNYPISDSEMRSLAQGNIRLIDFPYTQTPEPILVQFESGPIQKAILSSNSPTSSRLSLFTAPDASLSSVVKTPSGGRVYVYRDIVGLSENYTGKIVKVTLKTSGMLRYQLSHYENPDRLVIDLPGAITRLPVLLSAAKETAPYSRIRTSQFQFTPALTRVVFDLKERGSYSVRHTQKGLELTFPLMPTPSIQKTAKPMVAKLKKKTRLLIGKLIIIDPGHGGDDPGALAKDGSFEKDYTIDISKRLESLLTESGAHVMMCRSGDQNPSLEERTKMANVNDPDVFISVHINSFFSPFSGGTETYYYKYKDEALAKAVHQALVDQLQFSDKGLKRARLYVLRNSTVPAVLVEPLFITNRKELALLEQPYFRQKIADALFEGIKSYLAGAKK